MLFVAKKKIYYDIQDRLIEYPNAWIYLVVGGRSTGKTYSALKYMIDNNHKFTFVKRTMDDVDLLCSGFKSSKKIDKADRVDLSPFKPLNRDFGWNIKAVPLDKGLGAFYHCDEEDNPIGEPVGYIWALSGVTKFKGFDVSECDFIIFDEFIPKKWERVNQREGEELLDLYMTISRDRVLRGREDLKVLCLANATNVANPTFNMLELTDKVVEMQIANQDKFYDTERDIYLERLEASEDFLNAIKRMKVYTAMKETEWGSMAFGNDFGYDDFTQVQKSTIKKFKCLAGYKMKKQIYYIYFNAEKGLYYISKSQGNNVKIYNLSIEADAMKFFYDYVVMLRDKTVEGRCKYAYFSAYDLIMNYKKYYKI